MAGVTVMFLGLPSLVSVSPLEQSLQPLPYQLRHLHAAGETDQFSCLEWLDCKTYTYSVEHCSGLHQYKAADSHSSSMCLGATCRDSNKCVCVCVCARAHANNSLMSVLVYVGPCFGLGMRPVQRLVAFFQCVARYRWSHAPMRFCSAALSMLV